MHEHVSTRVPGGRSDVAPTKKLTNESRALWELGFLNQGSSVDGHRRARPRIRSLTWYWGKVEGFVNTGRSG